VCVVWMLFAVLGRWCGSVEVFVGFVVWLWHVFGWLGCLWAISFVFVSAAVMFWSFVYFCGGFWVWFAGSYVLACGIILGVLYLLLH